MDTYKGVSDKFSVNNTVNLVCYFFCLSSCAADLPLFQCTHHVCIHKKDSF